MPAVPAVIAHRLGDGQNVRLGEGAVEGRAAMAAGAETHPLAVGQGFGMAFLEVAGETIGIDQHRRRGRFPRAGIGCHGFLISVWRATRFGRPILSEPSPARKREKPRLRFLCPHSFAPAGRP